MPYKDTEKSRISAKLRKQKQRMSHPEDVTPKEANCVTPEHPIMKYLIHEKRVDDKPTNREKMVRIVEALEVKKLTPHVFLGVKHGIRLDSVRELLDVTG